MSNDAIAAISFVVLFALMLLRVPVGIAMGLVGLGGFGYINGPIAALNLLAQSPLRTATDPNFAIIPMFILMGALASTSGMSRELFMAANAFLGRFRGGLGIATIAACGGFSAICGSSVATAATFSRVAYPEMQRHGYPASFSAGVIAAGGTLGILIPPSVAFALYGIITQQDVGKLFIAGIVPGLLAIGLLVLTVVLIGALHKGYLPAGIRTPWSGKLTALRKVWAVTLLFVFVIGGLYGGIFTANEAAGMGAVGALVISVLRGKMNLASAMQALVDSIRTTASVFVILIGAIMFGYFLALTQTPQSLTTALTESGLNRYTILALIVVFYLVLGCLMDAMAMIVLTVPILYPLVLALGFDPIWFGVLLVVLIELGLVTPPMGMNVFVIKSVLKDLSIATIFKGVMPFVGALMLLLLLLIAFPEIVTWLPASMG